MQFLYTLFDEDEPFDHISQRYCLKDYLIIYQVVRGIALSRQIPVPTDRLSNPTISSNHWQHSKGTFHFRPLTFPSDIYV